MLTEQQLRNIDACEKAATPGPWKAGYAFFTRSYPDAIFIEMSRIWIPQLLTMVRELQRERDHFCTQIRDYAIKERGMAPADIDRILDQGAQECR